MRYVISYDLGSDCQSLFDALVGRAGYHLPRIEWTPSNSHT